MESELKNLIKYCKKFEMTKFKESERSISRALHIPYSGFGNPDYVEFYDFREDDVTGLILDLISNNDIKSIRDLKEAWENLDDGGTLHQHIESSLTWQQSLRDSDVIISNCDFEESDYGLWEGQQPEEAIATKAFYSYRADVSNRGFELIEEFETNNLSWGVEEVLNKSSA